MNQLSLTKSNLKKLGLSDQKTQKQSAPSNVSFGSNRSRRTDRSRKSFRGRSNRVGKRKLAAMRDVVNNHVKLVSPHVEMLRKFGTSYALERIKRDVSKGKEYAVQILKKSDLKSNYFSVDAKENPALQKDIDNVIANIDLIRGAMNAALGIHPIMIHLWMEGSNTSAATTAQAPVQRCRPSDSAEFSSLATLFDEYKMEGVANHWKFYQGAGTAGGVDCGVAYDPADSSAYGSLIGLLVAGQKQGPLATGSAGATAPQPFNLSGHYAFTPTVPKGPQTPAYNAASNVATGTWQDCVTTIADYGFFKWYVTAPSANTSSVTWHLEMKCLFRSRT